MSEIILGIDYGTSNTVVYLLIGDKIIIVEVNGSRVFPSVVAIPIDEDGEWLFGEDARKK